MSSVWLNPSSANTASMARAATLSPAQTEKASVPTSARSDETQGESSSYWSIATTMRAGSIPMANVQQASEIAVAVTDTAALGLDQATDLVARIQQKLVLAKAVGADRDAINGDINQIKADLRSLVDDSSFNGENWLQVEAGGRPAVASVLTSVTADANGELSINMVDFDTARSTLISRQEATDGLLTRAYSGTAIGGQHYNYYLMDARSRVPNEAGAREVRIDSQTTGEEIDGMISTLNRVLIDMVGAGAEVNALRGQVTGGSPLIDGLQSDAEPGLRLQVDPELNERNVRQSAEKVQRQLLASSLNMANVSMTSWLKL